MGVNYAVLSSCKRAITTFCQDIPSGDARVLACLTDNIEDERMSTQCQGVMRDFAAREVMRPALNYRLSSKCTEKTNDMCRDVHSSQLLSCLVSELQKEDGSKCHLELMRSVRLQSVSYDSSNALLKTACDSARKSLCSDVSAGGGRVHACLRENMSKLSQDCRDQEEGLMRNEAADYRINPRIQLHCQIDRRRHCSDVAAGGSRVMSCLKAHMYDTEFSTKCADVLKTYPAKSIPSYTAKAVQPGTTVVGGGGGDSSDSESFIQLSGWVALAAIAALVGVTLFAAVTVYRRYQTTSKGYTVVINKD